MDHFDSKLPGRIINLSGKTTNRKYIFGLIAKDHYSHKMFVEFQETPDTDQSIQFKLNMERDFHQ